MHKQTRVITKQPGFGKANAFHGVYDTTIPVKQKNKPFGLLFW